MTHEACATFVSDCHVRLGVELVSHGWDPVILAALRTGPMRRRDLLRVVAGISDKVATESLRRLRLRGLVERDDAESTTAVYRLTPLGSSLATGPLANLARWARDHADQLAGRP